MCYKVAGNQPENKLPVFSKTFGVKGNIYIWDVTRKKLYVWGHTAYYVWDSVVNQCNKQENLKIQKGWLFIIQNIQHKELIQCPKEVNEVIDKAPPRCPSP